MKFAVVVVLLAVALGIEASAVAWGPWGHSGWLGRSALNDGQWHEGVWGDRSGWAGHGAWVAPAAVAVAPAYGHGSVAIQAAAVPVAHASVAIQAAAVPVAHAAVPVAHAAVVPAVHAGWAHEGSYIAKTRGAVHVAPLAGHANSAASINLQPAPGTV